MTPETGLRVVLYARVSTGDQSLGLDLQLAKLAAYADVHDLQVIDTVTDDGVSARTLDRPGWHKIEKLLATGRIDGVVIYKLDRLSRTVADFAKVLDRFAAEGLALMSVMDQLDTTSAGGRLVVNIMASVAEWERQVIAERTRDALAQTKARGTYLGQPPVGYGVQDGQLVVRNPERVQLARKAKAANDSGQSLHSIANDFNRQGIPTGSGKGQWYPASVSRLLRAAAVA